MLVVTNNKYVRAFWLFLTFIMLVVTIWQIVGVINKYHRYDKIVDIQAHFVAKLLFFIYTSLQLVFDPAPFPAITLCNLNPYKRSSAERVSLVQRTVRSLRRRCDVENCSCTSSTTSWVRLERRLNTRNRATGIVWYR